MSPPFQEQLTLPTGHQGAVWGPNPVRQRRVRPYTHRHHEVEVNLVIAGNGTYIIGDRRIDIARHSLVWLFPGQDHILVERSVDYRMIIVVWRPELVARVVVGQDRLAHLAEPVPGIFCRTLAGEDARLLTALMGDVIGVEDAALVNQALAYLLPRCWAAHLAAVDSAAVGLHPAIGRVVRLLGEADDERDVPALAAAVGLSPDHLGRLFRRQVGMSLVDYRQRRRLDRFLDLVDRGGHTLLDAAFAAGFGSYAQFHRVFRRCLGQGPRTWLADRQQG